MICFFASWLTLRGRSALAFEVAVRMGVEAAGGAAASSLFSGSLLLSASVRAEADAIVYWEDRRL